MPTMLPRSWREGERYFSQGVKEQYLREMRDICLLETSVMCQHGENSKIRSVEGGYGMCMLFEICEKRPFQKCMGWRGVRWSQF